MKVSLHSQREYERKIRNLEQKIKRLEEKGQSNSKDLKYLKRRVKELTLSRDNWKSKNADKAQKMKGLKKRLKNKEKVKRHHYTLLIISLCVKLRVQAGCSYRGICKILFILRTSFELDLMNLPCANTIENWVSKMGCYSIEYAGEALSDKEVCLILDESIKQGNERILLMLITPWQKEKPRALCYQDVRVCYLGGKSSWCGNKIKEEVDKIVAEKGLQIKGVLSDEDPKLLKASRLLDRPHLPDINHGVATCLRKTFEKNEGYNLLIKQITSYQAKSVNQDLSYLRPPKQRVKARFMNQKSFVEWGLTMLDKFAELNEKEQAFFARLPTYEPMLKTLGRCINLGETIANMLKVKGLSGCTLEEIKSGMGWPKSLAFKGPAKPQFKGPVTYDHTAVLFDQFLAHLKSYVDKYEAFLSINKGLFNVSTDVIESMFGKHKSISGTNSLVGVSQLDLELPVHNIGQQAIDSLSKVALESVFMTDLKTWRKVHSADNQADKRRKFFKKQT